MRLWSVTEKNYATAPNALLVFAFTPESKNGQANRDIAVRNNTSVPSWVIYENDMARRHSNGSNILWADAHASFIDKATYFIINNNNNRYTYWNTFK